MAGIKPFYCIRPNEAAAEKVAALPYDVFNRQEAKEAAEKEPVSFLNIDRPETQFSADTDMYADFVYQKAREMFLMRIEDKTFIKEDRKCFYVYELIMNGRSQTGIAGCVLIEDYCNNIIKKHENTREDKEQDRIRHVDTLSAQTGPIFLAYRLNNVISEVVNKVKKTEKLYSFTADDGVAHNVWRISDEEYIKNIEDAFAAIDSIYIADGHHRAASAVKVGLKRKQENPVHNGTEEYNYFLSVLFPEDELMILPYNRVVRDLNGITKKEFLDKLHNNFEVKLIGSTPYAPAAKGHFGMYLDNEWYELKAVNEAALSSDAVRSLDVSILQEYLLEPILGIDDPRTDKRIDFIGGIRGLEELEKRTREDMAVAFSMYPTSIQELFAVSDAGLLMPPKSTWFEPKLRSGLFIHEI